jgi:hypothetical protein
MRLKLARTAQRGKAATEEDLTADCADCTDFFSRIRAIRG